MAEYYKFLQQVRTKKNWEPWILFMLDAVAQTSKSNIRVIKDIGKDMHQYKNMIRNNAPKIYSQDLLNNLFHYPYTKIEYLMNDLQISRNTAIRYLEQLQSLGLIEKKKVSRDNYYVNKALVKLLSNPDQV